MQYSMHTGPRADVDLTTLADAAQLWWTSDLSGIAKSQCHLDRVNLSRWELGPGFTGWHQVFTKDVNDGGSGGPTLPAQCAVVVGVRTVESVVPVRSRRNRAYLGMLQSGAIGADGRLSTTSQGALITCMQQLHDRFQGVPSGTTTAFDGLCVASPAYAFLLSGNVSAVGRVVDTQRRRREHAAEEMILTALT
jgi:hypothetical protein